MKPIKGEWYKIKDLIGYDGKEVIAQFENYDTGYDVYFCTFQNPLNLVIAKKYLIVGVSSLQDLEHIKNVSNYEQD